MLQKFLIKRALFGFGSTDDAGNPFDGPEYSDAFRRIYEEAVKASEEEYKRTGANVAGYAIARKGGSALGTLLGGLDRLRRYHNVIAAGRAKGRARILTPIARGINSNYNNLRRSPIVSLLGAAALGTGGYYAGKNLSDLIGFTKGGVGENVLKWGGGIGGGLIGLLGTAAVANRIKNRWHGMDPHDPHEPEGWSADTPNKF